MIDAASARWRRLKAAAVVFLLVAGTAAAPAWAQTRPAPKPPPSGPTPRAGSWEVSGGVALASGYNLDESAAELTRNTTTGQGPFTLFVTDSQVGAPTSLHGRLGYYFSPRLQVEAGFRFGQPVHTIEINGDAEGAPSLDAHQTLDQYVVDASLLWHFPRRGPGPPALLPFVFGGAGYLRELHEGQELVETGATYHAGAGLKYWFGSARRRFGLRGDGGVQFRQGGFDPEDKLRALPVASASLVYLF